jgi:hypothetical protein
VRPLGEAADIAPTLASLDASKAKCCFDSDRQQLLAVIEASFGTCAPFNKIARSILMERLSDELGVLAHTDVIENDTRQSTLPSGNASFLQTHRKKRENASWPRQEPARPQGRGPSRCRQSAQDAAYHLDVDSSRVCRENYPRPCTPHPWRTRFPAPLCCACVAKLLPTHEPPLDSSDVRQSICTRS